MTSNSLASKGTPSTSPAVAPLLLIGSHDVWFNNSYTHRRSEKHNFNSALLLSSAVRASPSTIMANDTPGNQYGKYWIIACCSGASVRREWQVNGTTIWEQLSGYEFCVRCATSCPILQPCRCLLQEYFQSRVIYSSHITVEKTTSVLPYCVLEGAAHFEAGLEFSSGVNFRSGYIYIHKRTTISF
jgi:hypothetical protein